MDLDDLSFNQEAHGVETDDTGRPTRLAETTLPMEKGLCQCQQQECGSPPAAGQRKLVFPRIFLED